MRGAAAMVLVLALAGCQLTVGGAQDLGGGVEVGTAVTIDPRTGQVLDRGDTPHHMVRRTVSLGRQDHGVRSMKMASTRRVLPLSLLIAA